MSVTESKSNAKIILMGEHSVVYGKSAIALPFFAAEIIARIQKSDSDISIDSEHFSGKLSQAPSLLKGVRNLIYEGLKLLNMENEKIKITVESTIPSQRGFGSSAAVSVAIAKALFSYANKNLTVEMLTDLVGKAEKTHHENPSGLDGDTIISKQAIYFKKGNENIKLNFNLDLDLVVGDTGVPASTKEAVRKVARNKDKEPFIEELGYLSNQVLKNIRNRDGESMGLNMNQAHRVLSQLGVSTDELDRLVNSSLKAGALGAKLSGGGLGGCMIALCKKDKTQDILNELKESGASSTWVLDLKEI